MNGKCIGVLAILSTCLFSLHAERVMVKTGTRSSDSKPVTAEVEPLTLTFKIDHDHVTVGEAVACELRAIFDPQRISMRGISLPALEDNFFVDPFQGPEKSKIQMGQVVMTEVVWKGILYPRKNGTFVIPSATIEYGKIESQRGSFFAWAFGDNRLYRLDSNERRIIVDPVPSQQKIDAVGEYQELRAAVDRTSVNQGDAIILSLFVRGKGNAGFEETVKPILPPGCTWYRDGIARNAEGAVYKFVVQIHQAQVSQIPPQNFIFYHPHKKEVKVLTSTPISLSVNATSQKPPNDLLQNDLPEDDFTDADQIVEKGQPHQPASLIRQAEIPPVYFLILVILVFICGNLWVFQSNVYLILVRTNLFFQKKYAYFLLRRKIKRAVMTAADAYGFIVRFSSTEREDDAWQLFWSEIERYYFGGAARVVLPPEVQQEMLIWINEGKRR